MSTVSTTIRIDAQVKRESTELLGGLGMSLSEAVNLFLHQVVLTKSIPFSISYPQPNEKLVAAMNEARRISSDPAAKTYSNIDEFFEDLDK